MSGGSGNRTSATSSMFGSRIDRPDGRLEAVAPVALMAAATLTTSTFRRWGSATRTA